MIRDMHHPLCRSWHEAGYDTACMPAGVIPCGLEDDCLWDPARVRIVGVAWTDCGFTWRDTGDQLRCEALAEHVVGGVWSHCDGLRRHP